MLGEDNNRQKWPKHGNNMTTAAVAAVTRTKTTRATMKALLFALCLGRPGLYRVIVHLIIVVPPANLLANPRERERKMKKEASLHTLTY